MSALDRFQIEDLLREAGRRSPTRLARAWSEICQHTTGQKRNGARSVTYKGARRGYGEQHPAADGIQSYSPDVWSSR